MNIREISKPVTAKALNESLAKRFGKKINLEAFTLEQLEDARNNLRTKLSQFETNESFDSVNTSDTYQKNKLFLDVLNAAVAEAQVLGVPAVVCNFGSLKERVKNNHTGFVCENDEDFSLKTIKLLKDDKTWMKMHKNLIKNNNHENWMEVAKKWQKIID